MANLTLCRFARNVSSFSRFAPKHNILASKNNGLLRKIDSATPFSTCLQQPLRISSGILPNYSPKTVTGLPISFLQNRAASTTGDHVRLWQIERIVAGTFIGLMPACIILENPIVDVLFASLVVMHAHWGLEAIIVDYARPSVIGKFLPKVAFASLYLISSATLVGLLVLIYNGPGIGKTVKNIWSIGSEPSTKN